MRKKEFELQRRCTFEHIKKDKTQRNCKVLRTWYDDDDNFCMRWSNGKVFHYITDKEELEWK